MKVSLVSITKSLIGKDLTPEELIVYCARVSNPENQANNETAPKLLKYLIDHKHWSPLEMVNMCVEIITSRAISRQILRHKSFSIQEFSQRYSAVSGFEMFEAREQDPKNRQNSLPASKESANKFYSLQGAVQAFTMNCYHEALELGVAREQARVLLPESATTILYMHGSVRSWYHYFDVRLLNSAGKTQQEHGAIAQAIFEIFRGYFPVISEVLTSRIVEDR